MAWMLRADPQRAQPPPHRRLTAYRHPDLGGVGGYLASHGDPWWRLLPFLALTLFFLALPALPLLVFGKWAQHFLPKARQWMNDNSWVVIEIVLGLFIALTISDIAG